MMIATPTVSLCNVTCQRASGLVQKSPFSKAAAIFVRRAYGYSVSAHGPKRAKPVSPKVRKNRENAAGGFFQQTQTKKWGLHHLMKPPFRIAYDLLKEEIRLPSSCLFSISKIRDQLTRNPSRTSCQVLELEYHLVHHLQFPKSRHVK